MLFLQGFISYAYNRVKEHNENNIDKLFNIRPKVMLRLALAICNFQKKLYSTPLIENVLKWAIFPIETIKIRFGSSLDFTSENWVSPKKTNHRTPQNVNPNAIPTRPH